jgi:hypothetical protein
MSDRSYGPGPIPVEGAVFDDFRLTDHLPPHEAPAVIERDRLIMAARPGFNRKLLPLRVEPETSTAYSGGRYLLDTYEDAVAFADWVTNDFAIDGVLILERPDFAEVSASVWRVIGAHDFKDIHTSQAVFRTEIWDVQGPSAGDRLANHWPALRDAAEAQGRSSLWLLHDEPGARVSLVTVVDRVADQASSGPDFASLRALEETPSQGAAWERQGWASKTFDRTHWIFTVWFPHTGLAGGKEPLWPNSPPLPGPAAAARSVA